MVGFITGILFNLFCIVTSGLAEWDTVGESLDALALANHRPIHIVGFAHPFHLKLAFSPKPISDDRAGQSMINYPAPPMQISRGPQLNTPRVVTVPAPTSATMAAESDLSSQPPAPFDVKAVEAEEAAYLENSGAAIAGVKRPRSPSPEPQPGSSPTLDASSNVHQPPKTPEEEDENDGGGERHGDNNPLETMASYNETAEAHQEGVARASSSELSEDDATTGNDRFGEIRKPDEKVEGNDNEEDGIYLRKTVHQPPATPPSESPSSASYSPIGEGED